MNPLTLKQMMKVCVHLPPQACTAVPKQWPASPAPEQTGFQQVRRPAPCAAEHNTLSSRLTVQRRGEGVADDPPVSRTGGQVSPPTPRRNWAGTHWMADYGAVQSTGAIEAPLSRDSGSGVSAHSMVTVLGHRPAQPGPLSKASSAFCPSVAPTQVPWGMGVLRRTGGANGRCGSSTPSRRHCAGASAAA